MKAEITMKNVLGSLGILSGFLIYFKHSYQVALISYCHSVNDKNKELKTI